MNELNQLRTVHPGEAYPALMPLSLDFHSAPLSDEQFEELCRNNGDMKFELTSKGELIIVTPTGPDSGWRNSELTTDVTLWAREDGTGIVFDSSTIFTFPNGAKRSPDVSWMTKDKWDRVSKEEIKRHSRVVPDFVIELLSPTDSLIVTQEKMEEYIANGVRLGWLIDPQRRTVHVYRVDGNVEVLNDPATISGDDVLKGFALEVRRIW